LFTLPPGCFTPRKEPQYLQLIFTGILTKDRSVRNAVAVPSRYSCFRMKVNQELIHRRKRGGFIESRMEEKMERHREQ
jgi:hypothetical protein